MSIIQLIADDLSVTRATVYRALRKQTSVYGKPAARYEVIRSRAKELGYRPSAPARAMRRGRTNALGLLVSPKLGQIDLPSDLQRGVIAQLAATDMHLAIARLPDDKLTSGQFIPRLLGELAVDGLLISYDRLIPSDIGRMLDRYRVPSVWINSKRERDCIYPDDLGGALALTHRLLAAGHRRVAYTDHSHPATALPQAHYSATDRCAGYEQAIRDAGLTPLVVRPSQQTTTDFHQRVTEAVALLARPDRPTAIITYGDARPYHIAARRLRLQLPRDLVVATFGDRSISDELTPQVTAVVPQGEIGRRAVDMARQRIAQPELHLPAAIVPLTLEGLDLINPPRSQEEKP